MRSRDFCSDGLPSRVEFSHSDLGELQAQLNRWREQQPGRAALPQAVWVCAATLACSLGVHRVSRVLRLDYYKLKRWMCQLPKPPEGMELAGPVSQASAFVEVSSGLRPGGGEYRAELSGSGQTAKLTLHLGHDAAAALALAQAFWKVVR